MTSRLPLGSVWPILFISGSAVIQRRTELASTSREYARKLVGRNDACSKSRT
jgi:hypothetical protein